jgi:peptide/nickel transport system substrate-binding protein
MTEIETPKNDDRHDADALSRRQVLYLGGGLGLVLAAGMPAFAQGKKDMITVALPNDVGGWDYDYQGGDATTLALIRNTMAAMLDYGVRDVDGGRIQDTETVVPLYAESWTANGDQTVWTLKVRQGMKFPSGNPLTAKDVKWSKDRSFAAQANILGLYRIIGLTEAKQVELVDDYTIRFTQPSPSALTPQIQIICLYIYDSELAKSHATPDDPWAKNWISKNPQIGGPFNITSYQPGQEMILEANKQHPVSGPAIPKIRLQIIPAAATRRLLLENGDVDMALSLTRRDVADLRSSKSVKVISSPNNDVWYVSMLTTQAPFDNPKVRMALAHAVPYRQIVQNVFNGAARRAPSPIPLDMPGHSPTAYPFDTDMAKAKALLQEAGMGSGFETDFYLVTNDPERERIAILLQASFAEIGVKLKINKLDPAALLQRNRAKSNPMCLSSFQWWINDIEYVLATTFKSGAPSNIANYTNARIEEIGATLRTTSDTAARNKLFAEAQTILAADVPWLVLCQPNFDLPVSAGLAGWVQPVDGMMRLKYLTAT